jgi:hypothetical protein
MATKHLALCFGVAIIISFLLPAEAAYCVPHSTTPKRNTNPIWRVPPKLLSSTKNGKLYSIGPDNAKILHVWGSPYEMGYAHGTLLKEQLHTFLDDLWVYLDEQVAPKIMPYLPPWLAYLVSDLGLQAALEAYYYMTKPYTGDYFYQELQGIADASGVAFSRIMQIQLLGEITKGRCSMFGAWGDSVPSGLLQLRALDWDVDGPYKDHALIVVYHADKVNNNPNSFINVGFVGWVGSISGMSSSQTAISEIGVSYPDETFGDEDPFGVPFVFLLRDVLQFDASLDDALNRMMNAQRTVRLILGVGDGKIESFRSIQYSHSIMRIMDDKNMLPYNTTWHPRIKDIVYYGMDWVCPGYNKVLSEQIQKFYGNITAENTISDILPIVQTGDLHAAIYDLVNMRFWVAFAAPSFSSDPNKMAYNRQYIALDATKLFSEARP